MSVDDVVLGGRYRLDGLIGRGGMASVWRAYDTELGRTVAVKRLHARLQDDPELAERFRREGQAVARLSHPNLVRLLDQGQQGDEPFLVFELVEGRDLKTIIRRDGRRPPAEAAAICAQVARALAAAHAAGVVHRDIKSHNVIVTDEGVAKLTDFGIARIVENEGANLTKTGIVMGSSDYLAPEQAEGKSVDHRGDIYSLGVVFYEMLTGKLPFAGDNPVAVATKHVYEEAPDPRKLVSEIPKPMAAACLRALAKKPAHRFADARAFANAVAPGAVERDTPANDDTMSSSPTGRIRPVKKRGRTPVVAAMAAAAVAVGGLAWWQAGGGSGSSASVLAIQVDDFDPLGDDEEKPELVSNATDGDAATAWQTEGYKEAKVAKGGVGLRITLASPARVTAVRVTSPTAGGRVAILGAVTDPVSAPELGSTVLLQGTSEVPVTMTGTTGEIVVWITELPPSGTSDFPFRASIGEVEVLGVANSQG